jgi:ketosteroid isomerase-like protein
MAESVSPTPATPAEVFNALVDGVARLILGDRSRIGELVALYAEHTEVVHPLSPLGDVPLRSRADLRRHFEEGPGSATGATNFAAVDRVVHQTTDPEVVIGEFRYAGHVSGRDCSIPCVFVLRVRDGLIVESHDYADHLGFARAFGYLDGLVAGLTGTT